VRKKNRVDEVDGKGERKDGAIDPKSKKTIAAI